MKKLLLMLLCMGIGPPILLAQLPEAPFSGTITASGCITVPTGNRGTVTFQVTGGTWTGTIQPQGVIDGNTAFNIQVTPFQSTTGQNTVTANGIYTATVAGLDSFKLCGATVTNTATVKGNAVQVVAKGGVSGGGGGGGSFSTLTSGTNTTAAMLVGSGASLGTTGTGTIIATSCPLCIVTGPVFYVSNAGNDANNGTSTTTPWQTAAKVNSAAASFTEGTHVLFQRGGSWNEQLWPNGGSGVTTGTVINPIVFGAYGEGNRPIFDGTGLSLPAFTGLVVFSNTNNLVIDSLEVRKSPSLPGIATANSSNLTISNCVVHDNDQDGINIFNASNVIVTGNDVYANSLDLSASYEGLRVGGNTAASNILIQNNHIHHNIGGPTGFADTANGIYLGNNVLSNVRVFNNELDNNGNVAQNQAGRGLTGGWTGAGGDVNIADNYVHDNAATGIFPGLDNSSVTITITHNYLRNNRLRGIGFDTTATATITFNTIFDDRNPNPNVGGSGIEYTSTGTPTVTITDNIISTKMNSFAAFILDDTATLPTLVARNTYWDLVNGPSTGSNWIVNGVRKTFAQWVALTSDNSTIDFDPNQTFPSQYNFAGLTSGYASIAAPAVAGTSTNPFTFSNVISLPAGGASSAALQFAGDPTTGIYYLTTGEYVLVNSGHTGIGVRPTDQLISTTFGFTNSPGDMSATVDTALSRGGAGTVNVGTGAAANAAGTLNAARFNAGLTGTASGIMGFNGLTSGTATLTGPAVAGTATNPIVSSNAITIPLGPVTATIASGTSALGTGAITNATCATVVTTSATGTATTDIIAADFNADPTGVTGYNPAAAAQALTIFKYPTANNVNFKVCNFTAGSITPGAITLNWRVVR